MKKTLISACLLLAGITSAYGQKIHITSPAAGASWCRGQSYSITWTSTGAVGASVRIRLMQGTAAVQEITLDTANDGSFDWPVPATTAPGSYSVRVRSKENSTLDDSAAFAIAACGSGPVVVKQLPKFERPPVGLLIPPLLRITDFQVNQAQGTLTFNAKNFGGPMKQDAQVIFTLDDAQIAQYKWDKGSASIGFTRPIFWESNPESLRRCNRLGGHTFNVKLEIQSPENQGAGYAETHQTRSYTAYADLAVTGVYADAAGKLNFAVGNIGECPTCSWSYNFYVMNQLVEPSPTHFGILAPGQWASAGVTKQFSPQDLQHILLKFVVTPDCTASEKNTANNTYEASTVAPGLKVVISDIRFAGEVQWGEAIPKASDEYYRLIYTLKSIDNKAIPLCYATCKTFIDGGLVNTQTFPIEFDPLQEIVLLHDAGFPKWPVLPYGIHEVGVEISICSGYVKKKMIRPPQG
jgi:hypothetical protein